MNYDELSDRELLKLAANSLRRAVKLFIIWLRRRRAQILWGLLTITAVVISLASFGGFVYLQATPARYLKRIAWATEISSNFRFYYLVVLALLTLLFLWGRKLKRGLMFAGVAILNLALLIPFFLTTPAIPAASQTYRALMINAGFLENSGETILESISNLEPDIIVLVEAREGSEDVLKLLGAKYPYSTFQSATDNYDGTLFYSKYPFTVEAGAQEGPKSTPSLVTSVNLGSRDLTFISTQTRGPLTPGRTVDRRIQLEQLAQYIAAQTEPVVLFGDLNSTAWSPIFRSFLHTSGLKDGREGFGLQASWPAFMPLLAIPIDHALVSSDVTVHSFSKGPDVGSDHFPIFIDFSLNADEQILNGN